MSVYSLYIRCANTLFQRRSTILWQRFSGQSNRRMCDKAVKEHETTNLSDLKLRQPTNFEKRIMVFNKFYPSMDAVPKEVPYSRILKAKDLFRLKASFTMLIGTIGICLVMIFFGKRAARAGESLTKGRIEEYHKQQEKFAASTK